MSRLYLFALVSFVILYNPVYGQQGVWRKDKEGKRVVVKDWPLFFKQLFAEMKAMKLAVYKYDDLINALDSAEVNGTNASCQGEDSFYLVDPVTGKEYTKARDRSDHYELISQFRLLEEWTYYPETQKTTIAITAIAPIKDIYGDDEVYRGSQAMCWIKWNAFAKFLHSFSGFDAAEKISNYLMADYMQDTAIVKGATPSSTFNKQNKRWDGFALRHIRLQPDTSYVLFGYSPFDTSITELLYRAASAGNCKVFKKEENKQATILSKENLTALKTYSIDTVMVEDIIADGTDVKIFKRDFCFECVQGYYVKEKWTLDMQKGSTEINYSWLAPIKYLTKEGSETVDGTEPLFWIRYKDVSKILSKYNEYHPVQNLQYQLWDERLKEPKHKPLCEPN